MLVTFDVSRSYQGVQPKHVQLRTGLGGGDCGFDFDAGKNYLVYASRNQFGHLSTGICTGTALLEDSQANLAYLRGDPIIPVSAKREVPIATGKLCGRVVRNDAVASTDNRVLLFLAGRKSPIPSDEVEPGSDGAFCATDVVPGNYHLLS